MSIKKVLKVSFISLAVLAVVGIWALINVGAFKPHPLFVPEVISTAAIYNDVNNARISASVPALSLNPLAIQGAEQKCQDMVTNDYYDHINPKTGVNGAVYSQKLIPSGSWFNENLNEGNGPTNQGWVDSWLNSPNHKATMLDPKYTDTGLAICHRPSSPAGVITIVQDFVAIPVVQSQPSVQSQAVASPSHVAVPSTQTQVYQSTPPPTAPTYTAPTLQTYNVPTVGAVKQCRYCPN